MQASAWRFEACLLGCFCFIFYDCMYKKAKKKQFDAVRDDKMAKNDGSLLSLASKPNVLLWRFCHYHQNR